MEKNPAFASVPAQENSLRVFPSGYRGGGEVDGPDRSNGKARDLEAHATGLPAGNQHAILSSLETVKKL
jgi:hypothetical protein